MPRLAGRLRKLGLLTEDEFDRYVDPKLMIGPSA